MFIGRERELKELNKLYKSDRFEFVVIYGRRRVGKTALINQFINDKIAIYFMGVESNAKQNLENLSKSILEFSSGTDIDSTFSSFQTALEYVFKLAEKQRIVMAIDEYPNIARTEKSLASTLQLLIDKYKDKSKLMIILCGSSMSYMEDEVLAYKAPLYGRKTAQLKINPFDFDEVCKYFNNFSGEEKALIYGMVGGTPQYLLQIDDTKSVEENIKNTFLNSASAMYEEPTNLLKQEVREPIVYNAIISAIAQGASRMSEISSKVGAETNVCATYLKQLIELGIIKKEAPYGEKNSKKSIYSVQDNLFRFWYRFVLPNNSVIARGASDIAYRRIEQQLSDYMGKVFEEICKQYLWNLLLNDKCPVEFSSLGRWWGNDPVAKKQIEIDIMGEQDKNVALFAECKWTNEKVDAGVLDNLINKVSVFNFGEVHYYLFSKTGFTSGCTAKAKQMKGVHLVEFANMLS
ncbi:MAG: ATP-binding protein [Bacteroides sp.]|nr:ATP-binding protein [Bacillota bacterium]MCM1393824.1 ATP-binding protein [[Eubacterium] siraeum]MCM1455455.1 ATP-binding protein [Bacteroides sp.]